MNASDRLSLHDVELQRIWRGLKKSKHVLKALVSSQPSAITAAMPCNAPAHASARQPALLDHQPVAPPPAWTSCLEPPEQPGEVRRAWRSRRPSMAGPAAAAASLGHHQQARDRLQMQMEQLEGDIAAELARLSAMQGATEPLRGGASRAAEPPPLQSSHLPADPPALVRAHHDPQASVCPQVDLLTADLLPPVPPACECLQAEPLPAVHPLAMENAFLRLDVASLSTKIHALEDEKAELQVSPPDHGPPKS
jgi:hypothetical protein